MSELKTQKTDASVSAHIATLDVKYQEDANTLLAIMTRASGEKPAMWGTSIVGFGSYHYKSERSRQEGDWPLTGFAVRKTGLSIYIMPGFGDYGDLMQQLGKYKTSVSCLYVKRLADVDAAVLEQLIQASVLDMRKRYPVS